MVMKNILNKKLSNFLYELKIWNSNITVLSNTTENMFKQKVNVIIYNFTFR